MPAPPEIAGAGGFVGAVEILRQLDAEKASQADGHVAIAAEVEIDLQREAEEGEPGGHHAHMDGVADERMDEGGDAVADQNFFGEADGEEIDAVFPARADAGLRDAGELRDELVVAGEGAGDEVREEGNEAGEAPEIALGFGGAAIDVDDVGNGLEGVKRDARGEDDLQGRE